MTATADPGLVYAAFVAMVLLNAATFVLVWLASTGTVLRWKADRDRTMAFLRESEDRVRTVGDRSLWRLQRQAMAKSPDGSHYTVWRRGSAQSPTTDRVFTFFCDENERIWLLDDLRKAGVSV